jgi:hypothetical protein
MEDECNTFLQITVNVYQTTRCHITNDSILLIKCCYNFSSQAWTKEKNNSQWLFGGTEWHDSTADTNSAQVRWNLIPHTNGTFLSHWPISSSKLNMGIPSVANMRKWGTRNETVNNERYKYCKISSLLPEQHTVTVYQLFSSVIFWLCEECKPYCTLNI